MVVSLKLCGVLNRLLNVLRAAVFIQKFVVVGPRVDQLYLQKVAQTRNQLNDSVIANTVSAVQN